MIERILVPVDFSPCSTAALDYAAALAEALDADLDVMHAWEPSHDWLSSFADVHVEATNGESTRRHTLSEFVCTRAGAELKRTLAKLERRGLRVRGRLEAGKPRDAIVEAAAKGGYDLVVIGTHGRTGVAHLVLGSVATWVVRHSTVPVLTVHEGSATVTTVEPRTTNLSPAT
jgi:universal stress protein A